MSRPSVVVDVQGLQSALHGERGIARYVLETSTGVEAADAALVDHYLLNPNLSVPLSVEPLLATGKLRADGAPPPGAGVFHMTSPFEGVPLAQLWPAWARSPEVSLVVTLYDVIPELYPEAYLATPDSAKAYWARRAFVQSADLVLAISESTARDAVDLLGIDEDKVRVVHAGVSPFFCPAPDRTAAYRAARTALKGLKQGFYLYTGGMDFRKNVDGLLAGYARLLPSSQRERRQLVIVCKLQPSEQAHYDGICRALGIQSDVLFTGYVSDETLRHLYQSAHVFLFPSLYEGFGLPVLEAMACGTAVLAGRNSSLVEIVRDNDCLFDAGDSQALTRALEAFEDDPRRAETHRSGRVPREYTWAGVSERIADAYAEELSRATRRRQHRRPKIAVVSPMPPNPSGVATYTERLVAALERHVTVDVLADGADRGPSAWSLERLDGQVQRTGAYDAVLYCVGNSEHHIGALEGALLRPGAVLLHDVRLDGLWSRAELASDATVREAAADVVRLRSQTPQSQSPYTERLDTTEVAPLVQVARAVLVHSSFARELVRLTTPPELHDKVQVVTFGAAPAGSVSRRQSTTTVVSLGLMHERKQTSKILTAFLRSAALRPDVRFAIVGPAEPSYRCRLELDLYRAAVDNVELVFDANDAGYQRWVGDADIAVQLRAVTNGESSAALMDCLGQGVPTIATHLGAVREIPPQALVTVPRDITAAELSESILALLADPERLRVLSREALHTVEQTSFDCAAIDILRALLDAEDLRRCGL